MSGSKFNPGGSKPAIPRVEKPAQAADDALADVLGSVAEHKARASNRVTMFGRRMNMHTWTPTEDVWSDITRANH